MKTVVPNYYSKFKCLAGNCKHSCCIGWEIDIDKDTFNYYQNINGDFGKKLKSNIVVDDKTAYFKMDDKMRCPFLNKNGLCDIMLNLGFDKVSQICDDHPRFRNFYSDRIEIGLGMSCEAVAKLIVSQKEKTELVKLNGDDEFLWEDEEEFLALRCRIFDILQDRNLLLKERIEKLLKLTRIEMHNKSLKEWCDIFLSFDKIDNSTNDIFYKLKFEDENTLLLPEDEKFEIAFEQIIIYFIYRHLTEGLDDNRLRERVEFCVLNYKIIYYLAAMKYKIDKCLNIDDIAEICRIYSSEIEYCPDTVEKILDILEN